MFALEVLPAERGDCLLIEYGTGTEPTNRVLIDGGPVNSGLYDGVRSRLLEIPLVNGHRHFDLLVISHIDADHIEGVIALLQDTEVAARFDDIWFNGWRHIEPFDPEGAQATLGGAHGEFLSVLLQDGGFEWNKAFADKAVVVPDEGALPTLTLAGGLELTLLSPTADKLAKLVRKWSAEIKHIGFTPGDIDAARAQLADRWWTRPPVALGDEDRVKASHDKSEANGSSIAFVATWKGQSVLLAADAHDDVLIKSLRRLGDGAPVPVQAFKLSHHGSTHNTTRQLLAEIDTMRYLVSTNGNRFGHPDPMTVLSIIEHHEALATGPFELGCNYRQDMTSIWEQDARVVTSFGTNGLLRLEL